MGKLQRFQHFIRDIYIDRLDKLEPIATPMFPELIKPRLCLAYCNGSGFTYLSLFSNQTPFLGKMSFSSAETDCF
jgi:hypothetical protein